jgi:hypothetical protein
MRAVEAQPGGLVKRLDPLIARSAKRQLRNHLQSLKDLLEAH